MAGSTFTLRVDSELKDAFMELAKQHEVTPAELIRKFMRDYIEKTQKEIEYDAWFRNKVEKGIRACSEGRVLSHVEVTARAEARKVRLLGMLQDCESSQ